MARQAHEIGAELRAALQERGCALRADEARALSCLLIDLIASGLLAADEPSETAPVYNMGSLSTREVPERER